MIVGLLLQAVSGFITWALSLLPTWTMPSQFSQYWSAIVNYADCFNYFLPVTDGIIPAAVVLLAFYGVMLVLGIVRGLAQAAASAL